MSAKCVKLGGRVPSISDATLALLPKHATDLITKPTIFESTP